MKVEMFIFMNLESLSPETKCGKIIAIETTRIYHFNVPETQSVINFKFSPILCIIIPQNYVLYLATWYS